MTSSVAAPPRQRYFRLLATGQALSWLGDGFQTVALAVAVVVAGGGASGLGLVLACQVLARLAGVLFGGVWADRLQPQRVMMLADLVRFGAVAGMAAMFGLGRLVLPVLCVLVAITAAAGAFFAPAMTALKPMLVPADRLRSANATLSLLQTSCTVLGPAAGGVVVAVCGAATGFLVNALSFAASAATVSLIRSVSARSPRRGMIRELAEGWAAVRNRDWLLSGVLAAALYHVANGVVLVLAQVIAIRQLGGAGAVGVIAAGQGLGGMAGAAVALRTSPTRPLLGGWLALPLMCLWVVSYAWPGVLAAVVVGAVLGYGGLSFFSVAWETAIQDHVPHHLLARVAAWDTLTSFVAMPVGNAIAGSLSRAFGVRPVLLGCALVFLGSSLAPVCVRGTRVLRRPTPRIADAQPVHIAA